MKIRLLLFILTATSSPLNAQMNTARSFFELFERHKLEAITSRRFNQAQMLAWLQPILHKGSFLSMQAGKSAEQRPIYLIRVGNGPTRVLLWSQMHGDESTATMALLDMLNFFARDPENPAVAAIRKHLTLLIIPMINPDGAERFQRRSAQLIDLNRDALFLGTPEARLLKSAQEQYHPDVAFNLHDQDPRYTVGQSKEATAIALLAPAFDESRGDNEVRLRAKHLAAHIAGVLNEFIPGHVAKYDDTFEPRAFGDNIQKWGTSTVLIESGGWKGDREKMFLRKLNFVAILSSLDALITGDYRQNNLEAYEQLPTNGKNLCDLILRNARFQGNGSVPPIAVDIGLNFEEETDSTSGKPFLTATVVELGDLSTFGAFQEIDCGGTLFDSTFIEMDKKMRLEEVLDLVRKK